MISSYICMIHTFEDADAASKWEDIALSGRRRVGGEDQLTGEDAAGRKGGEIALQPSCGIKRGTLERCN